MDKIYKILNDLHNELDEVDGKKVLIVPHDTASSKIGSTYITYKILTSRTGDLTGEFDKVEENGEVYEVLNHNFQGTVSFNVVSQDDTTGFAIANNLYDLLAYTLKESIYIDYDVVVLGVTPVRDVTVRIADTYSHRYNVDLRYRDSKLIKRKVGSIEEAKIKWR